MEEYTMLIQKSREGSVIKDSLKDFNMAISDIPFQTGGEIKEPAIVNTYGEHGERVFFPDNLWFSAYDMEVGFICKGSINTTKSKYKSFIDYLMGKDGFGTELMIYIPKFGMGRKSVRLKSIGETKMVTSNIDECLTFKCTFRVSDPVTDVVAIVADGILKLAVV